MSACVRFVTLIIVLGDREELTSRPLVAPDVPQDGKDDEGAVESERNPLDVVRYGHVTNIYSLCFFTVFRFS